MIHYINPKNNNLLVKLDENFLIDQKTNEKFPIKNKIPRIISSNVNYAQMWGEQWGRFQLTQFDSFSKKNLSKDRLEFMLGESINVFKGKKILEVGSGAGRFTELIASTADELYTVDASEAIDYNKKNNSKFNNIHFTQADLFNIPFENGMFDYVICVGVIQHTPDTLMAIDNLWKKVKPGGKLIFDHYQFSLRYFFGTTELFRFFVKRMDNTKSIEFCKKLVDLFFPIFWKIRKSTTLKRILKKIIPLGIDTSKTRDSFNYNDLKDWTYLDTHDALADPIKNLISKSEMIKILSNIKSSKIELISGMRPGGNGLEVRISKI
jgi:2-polyprenyl-3-methyl-5-hydroxy-6-metoxy-1,4-benzoquinol methylase